MTLEKRLAAASSLTVVAAALLSASLVYGAVTLEPKIAVSSLPRIPEPMPVAPVIEPVGEPDPEVDPVLAEQLAILIYREAGGDACCDDCRIRVADVALNRVADERFPNTLEAVLTQKKQYGTMYWDGVTWPERAENPAEAEAVARARERQRRQSCPVLTVNFMGTGTFFKVSSRTWVTTRGGSPAAASTLGRGEPCEYSNLWKYLKLWMLLLLL